MMIWRKGFIAIFLTSLWSFLFVEEVQLGLMLKLLETIIDLWFGRGSEDIDNIQMWTPSAELQKVSIKS